MFIAIFKSAHYEFITLNTTRESAITSLQLGLQNHALHRGIPLDWWHAEGWSLDDLANVYEIEPGQTLRDGAVVWEPYYDPSFSEPAR